jgi:CRISPR/Cas system-associated exonuclease Cas4 (RecB family)
MVADLAEVARRVQSHAIVSACAGTTRAMRERPFILRTGEALLRGEIDALLPDGRVLDYKTGTRHAEVETRYLWQLRLYAAAVEALDGAVADEAILFYVDSGETVPVDVSAAFRAEALQRAAAAIEHVQRDARRMREDAEIV